MWLRVQLGMGIHYATTGDEPIQTTGMTLQEHWGLKRSTFYALEVLFICHVYDS